MGDVHGGPRPTIAGAASTLQCAAHAGFRFRHRRRRHRRGFRRLPSRARMRKVVILEREHVPAYHTTGRSAALHSETYGSAEIRAITVASGRFYRKPPPGFTDHPLLTPRGALIAGRAEQEADDARRPPPTMPAWCRACAGSIPAEVLRRQPLLKPEAAAGGAIFEPEADDMDVAAIHGGFLKGARAAGARAAPQCRGRRRSTARTDAGPSRCATARRVARRQHHQRRGRLGRRAGRPGRLRAGRPGAEAAHRLHLRCAARARSRAPADGDRLRRDLLLQARGRPVPGLARRRDALAALRRPARGDRRRHRRRAHRDGEHAHHPPHQEQVGRACAASSPTRTWSSATTPRSKASSGWPARAATASRPARRPAGWPPSLALGKGLPADIAELGVTEAALSPARFTRR